MASDRGKQQAYCKVCSKHFSVSHGGIDDVCRHGEKTFRTVQRIFVKITDFPRVVPHFFFRNLTCLSMSLLKAGFYTKLNVWGSLGLNFEYDGGPIIEIGGPIFLYKLRILEGSTSFREGSVLSPGQ